MQAPLDVSEAVSVTEKPLLSHRAGSYRVCFKWTIVFPHHATTNVWKEITGQACAHATALERIECSHKSSESRVLSDDAYRWHLDLHVTFWLFGCVFVTVWHPFSRGRGREHPFTPGRVTQLAALIGHLDRTPSGSALTRLTSSGCDTAKVVLGTGGMPRHSPSRA